MINASAVAEAETGFYLMRYPYRRYNKLGSVTDPISDLISEKRCSCSKLVLHAELIHCVQQPPKKIDMFSYLLTL